MTRAETLARAILDGSALDEDVKELARLTLEAFDDKAAEREALTFYAKGMLRPLSAKQRIIYAYESGMRREYRTENEGSCNG